MAFVQFERGYYYRIGAWAYRPRSRDFMGQLIASPLALTWGLGSNGWNIGLRLSRSWNWWVTIRRVKQVKGQWHKG